jgi:type II secretory pathway pseudopilin PulG
MKFVSYVYKNIRINSGFTMIEILISVIIMFLMLGIGAASYRNFNNTQLSKSALANLKNDLRDIANNANSGVNSELCSSSGSVFGGYQIVYVSVNSYKSQISCSGVDVVIFDNRTFILPSGIEFQNFFTSFLFQPISKGVITRTTINLKNTKSNK